MSLYKNVSREDTSGPLKIISNVTSRRLGALGHEIRYNQTCLLYFSHSGYEQI